MKRLKATGEYDSTVLALTSDNGFYIGEHRQRLGKIKAYEPVIHVPLVVAGPGIPHGVRYSPITTFDLTATILDLAGAAPLPDMDGSSKVPELLGPDRDWTVPVVTEGLLRGLRRKAGSGVPAGLTTSGLRTGRYKLIRYATGESELYDLATDPNELGSVWRDPAYAEVRRRMVDLWEDYRSCARDACRRPVPADLVVEVAQVPSSEDTRIGAFEVEHGAGIDVVGRRAGGVVSAARVVVGRHGTRSERGGSGDTEEE